MIRYVVERVSDGVFLDLDFPVVVDGAGRALCGAGRFSGSVAPDVGASRMPDGSLLVEPYATFIHEESDGVIRGTWLVTFSGFDGPEWKIEGAGFSAFLDGRPYEGEFRGVDVDMADVVRHVWAYVQGQAGGNIGVTVSGMTGVRRGTKSDDVLLAAEDVLDSRKNAKKAATAARQAKSKQIQSVTKSHDAKIKPLQATSKARLETLQALRKQKKDTTAATAARAAAVAAVKAAQAAKTNALAPLRAQLKSLQAAEKAASDAQKKAEDAVDAAKKKVDEDGGAWKLLWWDTPDCGTAVKDAVDEAGFEWVEWSGWNGDRTRVLKEIRVVPRVGRKQDGLLFVEGDNIVETVVVDADSADYANAVIAVGAGEGRKALRSSLAVSDGRLRKVAVLDAKHVTKKTVLDSLAREELARRSRKLVVDSVRLVDHPNAEFGVFGVGDTVLIDADVEWLGRQRLWHRIVELEWVGDDFADLVLEAA